MTVSSTISSVTYDGGANTSTWWFPFKILNPTELQVWRTDAAGRTSLVSSGYAIDHVNPDAGGSITYPVSGPLLVAGEKLTLRRVVQRVQELDLQNQGGFFPDVIETQFDRVVMMIQEVEEKADRAVKVGISSNLDPDALIAEVYDCAAAAVENAAAAAQSAQGATAAEAAATEARLATEAARDQALAGIGLPQLAPEIFIQADFSGGGWTPKTPVQVRAAIAAEPVDQNILRANAAATLTRGYGQTVHALGDVPASLTPDIHQGAMQEGTVAAALTINPPLYDGVMEIRLINTATSYTVALSGYTKIGGEYTAGGSKVHLFRLTRYGATKCIAEIVEEIAA